MKSSTDKEALLLLTHLIEFVYRLLWGDLLRCQWAAASASR